MMVTASYPSQDDDRLLGVASREITFAKVGTAGNAPVEVDGERALVAHIENGGWLLILVRP